MLIYYSDMSTQVNNICKSTYLAIRNIGKIRNYLDQPTAEKLVHAFVTSKLDFCNSLLYRLSKKQLDKLQRIQNAAASIKKTQKFQHISAVLRNLHWLPVTKRIEFKILTITYKALNGMAPSYICDLLQVEPAADRSSPKQTSSARFCITGLSLVVAIHQTQANGACSFSVAMHLLSGISRQSTIKTCKLCFSLKESSKHF